MDALHRGHSNSPSLPIAPAGFGWTIPRKELHARQEEGAPAGVELHGAGASESLSAESRCGLYPQPPKQRLCVYVIYVYIYIYI